MNTRLPRLAVAAAAAVTVLGMSTAPAMAAPGNGANQECGAYCPNPGAESMNGNGGGNATGRPAAGTAGNADSNPADSKYPPGQAENGGDANNGYECDGNNGIAKGNPAHTACEDVPPPS